MNNFKLKEFIAQNNGKNPKNEQLDEKEISQKDGLLERVDKKLVTKDGKQLLREQLHEI